MWLYHLAPNDALASIKLNGLKSAFNRTGKHEASPTGAFMQNRNKNEPKKIRDKLGAYITALLMEDFSRDNIKATNPGYLPFQINYSSSLADHETVVAEETKKLTAYKNAITGKSVDEAVVKLRGALRMGRRLSAITVRDFAPFVAFADGIRLAQDHYLTKLATQYVHSTYTVEEWITSANVYFFVEEHAEKFYEDYSNHLGAPATVLRVDKEKLFKVERDNSESRGFMTPEDVKPEIIEIMTSGSFGETSARGNAANWKNIKTV